MAAIGKRNSVIVGEIFAFNSSYLSSVCPFSEREPHSQDQLDKADEVDQQSHALDQLDEVEKDCAIDRCGRARGFRDQGLFCVCRVRFFYSPYIKNSANFFAFERVAVVDEPLAKQDKQVPAMEEQSAKKR